MNLRKRLLALLQKLNLTENEARFYVLLNQNPGLTLNEVQNKLQISNATTYRIFDKLTSLGLITSSQENWRKNISSVSISALADLIARENRKLKRIELELKDLDNLMNLNARAFKEDPIKILYDKNQIAEQNYKILHKPWNRINVFGSGERLIDVVGEEHEKNFVKIRTRMGKSVNLYLTEYGEYASEFMPKNEAQLRDVKLDINPDLQDYMTYIYDDEVTIWHKDKKLGNRAIIIDDPFLVRNYKSQFEYAWKNK
jgi:DNA-binding MarR family transcriptional regulator